MLPRLYASWWCPFANRATLACHLKGLTDGLHYEYRETMPYKREPEFIEVSPKALVPAIRIGDEGFCESLVAVEFIDEYFPGPKLLVGDPLRRAQQRQIVDHASKEVFVNHFKIISSQEDYVRAEAIEKVGDALKNFIRQAEDKSNYFIGDRATYVEACMVPFAWHTHLAKAFRGVEMHDFLSEKTDLDRWNAWFEQISADDLIKPVLAEKSRLENAYQIYTTGEGPAQALKAIKKGEAPP